MSSGDLVDAVTGGFDNIYDRFKTADHRALQVLLHVGHEFFLSLEARYYRSVRVRVQVLKVGCKELVYRDSKRFQSM